VAVFVRGMSALESPDAKPSTGRTTDDGPTADELLDLLGDEYTRRVFEAVAERPRSGRGVAEATDVSRATAYRRLNDLRDAGLVTTDVVISENGNHHDRFEAVADELAVSLADGDIEAAVSFDD
jgi:DNA-binding transcriptional ArsR family regulator